MTPPEPTTAVTVTPPQSASVLYPVLNIWELKANPVAVQGAAEAWRRLADALRDQATTIDKQAKPLHDGEWRGDTAETFHDHRLKLTRDMHETAAAAHQAADALRAAATNLTEKQAELRSAFKSSPPLVSGASVFGDYLLITLLDEKADKKVVDDALAKARDIRSQLNYQLYDNWSALGKARDAFDVVAMTWLPDAGNGNVSNPFVMPPAAPGPRTIVDYEYNQFIVNAGGATDNEIEVKVDPDTGHRTVVITNNDVYDETTGRFTEPTKTEFQVPNDLVLLIQNTQR